MRIEKEIEIEGIPLIIKIWTKEDDYGEGDIRTRLKASISIKKFPLVKFKNNVEAAVCPFCNKPITSVTHYISRRLNECLCKKNLDKELVAKSGKERIGMGAFDDNS